MYLDHGFLFTTAYILAKELVVRGVAQRYCRMETYLPACFVIRLD
jgi:hypothetical protein